VPMRRHHVTIITTEKVLLYGGWGNSRINGK
jgi:hypothetical protein